MAPKPKAIRRADGTLRWRLQFREAPGTTPTSETFDSPEAAERFAQVGAELGWAEARRIRYGTSGDYRVPTLATWLEVYLEQSAASSTPGTVDDNRRMAARTWLPSLGRYPLDMLSRDMVVAWVGRQRRQETVRSAKRRAVAALAGEAPPPVETYSPKSISNAQRLLSTVLEAATSVHGTINVAKGVPLPDDAAPSEMVFLTPAEFERLYAAVPAYWRPLIACFAGTGARWGEVTALQGRDFALDADTPHVRIARAYKRGDRGSSYIGAPKSRRGVRTVSLSPSTVAALRDRVETAGPDELVFRGVRGGRVAPQNFHPRVWRPALAASGLTKQPRIHDLRHSHASWLIHQGVPLPIIQYRLGHESITTTVDRYGHIMPEAGAVAADAVERAMGEFAPGLAMVGEVLELEG